MKNRARHLTILLPVSIVMIVAGLITVPEWQERNTFRAVTAIFPFSSRVAPELIDAISSKPNYNTLIRGEIIQNRFDRSRNNKSAQINLKAVAPLLLIELNLSDSSSASATYNNVVAALEREAADWLTTHADTLENAITAGSDLVMDSLRMLDSIDSLSKPDSLVNDMIVIQAFQQRWILTSEINQTRRYLKALTITQVLTNPDVSILTYQQIRRRLTRAESDFNEQFANDSVTIEISGTRHATLLRTRDRLIDFLASGRDDFQTDVTERIHALSNSLALREMEKVDLFWRYHDLLGTMDVDSLSIIRADYELSLYQFTEMRNAFSQAKDESTQLLEVIVPLAYTGKTGGNLRFEDVLVIFAQTLAFIALYLIIIKVFTFSKKGIDKNELYEPENR